MANVPFRLDLSDAALTRAAASVAPLSKAVAAACADAGPGALTVAWLSDLHLHAPRDYGAVNLDLYGTSVDCSANLRVALAEVAALQPRVDLIIFGGDLTDSGCGGEACGDELEEFGRLLDAHLPPDQPSLVVLGNHDHADTQLSPAFHNTLRRIRRRDWPDPAETDDCYSERTLGGWRFLVLDSRQGQRLSDRQREWLAARTNDPGAPPTVILLHRPFLAVGNWVDNHRLVDRASFDVIDRAPAVRAILAGHTHKAAAWQYRRKVHAVFPSTAVGIGETCGWGCVVLAPGRIHSVFVKELAMRTVEIVRADTCERAGVFRRLDIPLYESSPLCDPCLLPWRADPAARD